MPYLRLETNVAIPGDKADALLRQLSAAVTKATGKPESSIQASLAGGVPMFMAGSAEPTAHVEVKGIGFPEEHARLMSEIVCALLERELGVPGRRTYLTCAAFKGSMWGADGRTY